jgi:hypothetical protein
VFDDLERFTLLMLLWNYRQQAEAANSGPDVPAARVEAFKAEVDRHNQIVKKLGGDPTKPSFGASTV